MEKKTKTMTTKTITAMALLIAMHVVFVRVVSIGAGAVRISLGFLPLAISGMIFGPVGGGLLGAAADFIGMLLFAKGEVYFFPLTISEFLQGFCFGLFLHKKNLSALKLSLCVTVGFILINLILSSFWLYLYYIMVAGTQKGFFVILSGRFLAALVNLPMQIIGVNVINQRLREPLMKIGR